MGGFMQPPNYSRIMTSPLYSLKAWKGISSDAFSKCYHLEGSGIFRRWRGKCIAEKIYEPTNPRTPFQQEGRSMFALAVTSWQNLSDEVKDLWRYYQERRRKRPVMDGYNLYISKFLLTSGNPQLPIDMVGGFTYTFPFVLQ